MIKVDFFSLGDSLEGFEVSGHSGFADAGEDIICSAVSSAVYMAANTITDVVCQSADIKVDEGYLYLVTDITSESQTILKGLQLHLISLSKDYPKNIKVKTSKRRCHNA